MTILERLRNVHVQKAGDGNSWGIPSATGVSHTNLHQISHCNYIICVPISAITPAMYGLIGTRGTRHGKTDLKVFVVVIPKEGLAGWSPTNPSLGMTPTTEYKNMQAVDQNLNIQLLRMEFYRSWLTPIAIKAHMGHFCPVFFGSIL